MSMQQGISTYELGKSAYSRFNVSESVSDIRVFVREFRERVTTCLKREEEGAKNPFRSFAEKQLSVPEISWLQDNTDRFLKDTANECLVQEHYLAACGFICSMIYTPDGENVILGHSSGLIQNFETWILILVIAILDVAVLYIIAYFVEITMKNKPAV